MLLESKATNKQASQHSYRLLSLQSTIKPGARDYPPFPSTVEYGQGKYIMVLFYSSELKPVRVTE